MTSVNLLVYRWNGNSLATNANALAVQQRRVYATLYSVMYAHVTSYLTSIFQTVCLLSLIYTFIVEETCFHICMYALTMYVELAR